MTALEDIFDPEKDLIAHHVPLSTYEIAVLQAVLTKKLNENVRWAKSHIQRGFLDNPIHETVIRQKHLLNKLRRYRRA